MREPRRLFRRLTDARLVSRAIAHLAVIGLVAFTSAIGIAAARGQSPSELGLDLVSRAQAALPSSAPLTALAYVLAPQAGREQPDPEPLRMPGPGVAPLPKPTPVPLSPDATPLPAPTVAPQTGFVQQPPTTATLQAPAAPDAGGTLMWPVVGGEISQYFSAGHLAIDIAAPAGNTVLAADAGVVTSAGWRANGGGLVLEIDHGNGIITVYNHLGSIWVWAGQAVARGEGIAAVGCTGICTGPHVHLEVIVGGVLVNPLRYL